MSENRIIFNSTDTIEPISISANLLDAIRVALAPDNAFYSLGERSHSTDDTSRFSYLTFAPDASSPIQMGIGVLANYAHFVDLSQIEYLYIVRGELTLERHDGQEVTLTMGDLLVVNGMVWRWHNHGDIPVTAIAIAFDVR